LPADTGFSHSPYVINATTHLLGTKSGGNAGIFRTTDGGASWTQVYKGGVTGQPLVARDGAMYWVRSPYGGIIKSTDSGITWAQVARDGTVTPEAPNVIELADGRLVAAGSRTLVISADKGATWRTIGPAMPISPTGLTYSPSRNSFYIWFWSCNDEGGNPVLPTTIMRLDFVETTPA
jgi:hypothetical protein